MTSKIRMLWQSACFQLGDLRTRTHQQSERVHLQIMRWFESASAATINKSLLITHLVEYVNSIDLPCYRIFGIVDDRAFTLYITPCPENHSRFGSQNDTLAQPWWIGLEDMLEAVAWYNASSPLWPCLSYWFCSAHHPLLIGTYRPRVRRAGRYSISMDVY